MNLRTDFINALGINLNDQATKRLLDYIDLIWEKKDNLNLTSVLDKQEIWDRHILDGLQAAAVIKELSFNAAQSQNQNQSTALPSVADFGAGAGYIGLVIKIALDNTKVSLIESLQKRSFFMEWAILKLALKNVEVLNMRAGGSKIATLFDFTTERAMGKIDDVLPICAAPLKAGGYFLAYQGEDSFYNPQVAKKSMVEEAFTRPYFLPCDSVKRKLTVFKKWI